MKKFWQDFKKFITKGNVLDLAVATIIGASFSTIVSSFTNGIIMPIISLLFQVENLDEMKLLLKPEVLDEAGAVLEEAIYWQYGTLLQAVINFLIVALFLFILVRVIAKVKKSLDLNVNMCEIVQKKLDNDEELNDFEEKWLKGYVKRNPDLAPKKKEEPVVEEPKAPELTVSEKLLTEILEQLKKSNGEDNVKNEN